MISSLTALLAALRRRHRAMADARALRDLGPEHLADLGIRRDEIPAYVSGRLTDRAGPALGRRPMQPPRLKPVLRMIRGGAERLSRGRAAGRRSTLRLAVSNG